MNGQGRGSASPRNVWKEWKVNGILINRFIKIFLLYYVSVLVFTKINIFKYLHLEAVSSSGFD